MNRLPLFFALSSLALACGDDASSDEVEDRDDAAVVRDDAAVVGDTRDAKAEPALDAMLPMEAAVVEVDASEPAPDAGGPSDTADAAGFDATVDASACLPLGGDCQQQACCEGTMCTVSSEAPYPVCAQDCATDDECESGCCKLDAAGGQPVCAPAEYCIEADPTAPLTGIGCYDNLNVYDEWGEYMGKATYRYSEDDSVCKDFGQYGKFGTAANKLWDRFGAAYATELNRSAVLGCGGNFPVLAYVSKFAGQSRTRVIDPDYLCDVLENSNL